MIRVRSTFVVEIDPLAPSVADALRGRVEHVLSGARSEFDSSDRLVRFIVDALGSDEDTSQESPEASGTRSDPGRSSSDSIGRKS